MLLCQQYVPNLVLYCLKRNSQTFRGAEMFFFIVQQLLCCKTTKDYKTHLSNRGLLLSKVGAAHIHRAYIVF